MWKFSQLSAKKLSRKITQNKESKMSSTTNSPPEEHIHVIVKLPLLSLEEALSCIPPPITYSPDCTKSKTTTKVNGDPPTSVQLWGDFFDKVNQFRFDQQPIFERPQFIPDKVAYGTRL
ncbi:unnamed protein product [Rhizophagus irregularis]|nr:unnamed protein product [Rhizophagus irregularis]